MRMERSDSPRKYRKLKQNAGMSVNADGFGSALALNDVITTHHMENPAPCGMLHRDRTISCILKPLERVVAVVRQFRASTSLMARTQ